MPEPKWIRSDRTGASSPPLPCPVCTDLVTMTIAAWDGRICACLPECDIENAKATVTCGRCGTAQDVRYYGDPSFVDLTTWFGGAPGMGWEVEIFGCAGNPPALSDPNAYSLQIKDTATAANQWLHRLRDRLPRKPGDQ